MRGGREGRGGEGRDGLRCGADEDSVSEGRGGGGEGRGGGRWSAMWC